MRIFSSLIAQMMVCCCCGAAVAADVQITVTDTAPYHVHPPGTPFSVDVQIAYSGTATITCQWHDFEGKPLGNPVTLTPSLTHTITSPSTQVGYYELVFKADSPTVSLADRNPGQVREYGFAVLPTVSVASRKVDSSSPFGMVHADMNDPYLIGWIKTMTWASTGTQWWKYEMDKRRNLGLIELPMAVGTGWTTDDTKAVTSAELSALQSKIQGFFAADSQVLHWELGIEENLSSNFDEAFYWPNLAAKVGAVRKAADAVNPQVKLIYQVVGTQYKVGGSIDLFLSSQAAKTFDILSLHPYRWPDFPAPDTWLADLINSTTAQMKAKGTTMPIWFTEVGAPHHGNPGGFFGYPSSGSKVTGLTREREATYMTKIHVIALHAGVERVFWYNYKDKGSQLEYAEDHFGMVDYWKFPKAVYPAYYTMHSRLGGKTPTTSKQLPDGVRVFEFSGAAEDCIVAWVHPAADKSLPLSSLRPGLSTAQVIGAVNTVGTPVSVSGGTISLSKNPVFITAGTAPAPDAGPPADAGPPPAEAGSDAQTMPDAPAGDGPAPKAESGVADDGAGSADGAGEEDPRTLESGCGCLIPARQPALPVRLPLVLLLIPLALVWSSRRRCGKKAPKNKSL